MSTTRSTRLTVFNFPGSLISTGANKVRWSTSNPSFYPRICDEKTMSAAAVAFGRNPIRMLCTNWRDSVYLYIYIYTGDYISIIRRRIKVNIQRILVDRCQRIWEIDTYLYGIHSLPVRKGGCWMAG